MENLRFKWMIVKSIPVGLLQVRKANRMIRDKEKYTEQEFYSYAKVIMDGFRRRSGTKTLVFGKENLPTEDNYILYSNHQGKYDALGILLAMDKPTSVLFGKAQAIRIMARQICGLVDAVIIDQTDIRDAMRAIKEINAKVLDGKNMLVFPEGGYTDNHNNLQEFQTGCFACSLRTKKPVVPVAIYDSWKSMNTNKLFGKAETQVHFLEPIYYETYQKMRKNELAALVRERIEERMMQIRDGGLDLKGELI